MTEYLARARATNNQEDRLALNQEIVKMFQMEEHYEIMTEGNAGSNTKTVLKYKRLSSKRSF